MTIHDVIAVFSTRWGQFLLCVVIGGVACLLGDAWQHRPRRLPKTLAQTEIHILVLPRPFSEPAKKGLAHDHRHTVIQMRESEDSLIPQPLQFPVVSPHVAAHSILSACADLKAAIDAAETHDEFMSVWAIVRDCWNQIEAVSRYARVAADKDR